MEEQVVSIYAGVNGYLDKLDPKQVADFEEQLLQNVRAKGQALLKVIREEGKISDKTQGELKSFLEDFAEGYAGKYAA